MGWVTLLFSWLLSSGSSIHYFVPEAANCCRRRRRTLPAPQPADCVEWPATAALLCLWLQYSLTPPTPTPAPRLPLPLLIVGRHGYHSEPAATAVRGGSLVVKKSHAVCSDTLFSFPPPKAPAPARHHGFGSGQLMPAKQLLFCFVVVCPLFGLHAA